MALAVGEQIKEHTSLVLIGSDTEDDESEFEGHVESDEEPSEGEISEVEDNDDDDKSEDSDDGDESDARSDDKYKDWDNSDYQGPWNNDEDDESGYYSPRDPGGYSVYAISEDDPMINPIDAIQLAIPICMEEDGSTSDSESSEDFGDHENIFDYHENSVADLKEKMCDIYVRLDAMKL
ncbi:prostatic spermine-binding protein-like [Macadamia integrifolia]|uniref:prostatic spermine-binding protein-like n=1 Tax=Macadamia integrifolia TaxID=60698 RepID=UPI001C4E6DC1|nr:prostatic spermine-binding protein-like [Macadamia integrifolia]